MQIPRHAFIMNVHRDIEQFEKTIPLLLRYWTNQSSIFAYFDGPESLKERVLKFENQITILSSSLEPNKSRSSLNALSSLCQAAHKAQFDTVSFLHADMIPLHPVTFYSFIKRFSDSKKALTFTPVVPRAHVIEFCSLHFNLNICYEKKLLPVYFQENRPDLEDYGNEKHLVASLQKNNPEWTRLIYPLWMISYPYTAHEMVTWAGSVIAHNFVPETTVIHTNDAWFWDNYAQISDFSEKTHLKGLSTANL